MKKLDKLLLGVAYHFVPTEDLRDMEEQLEDGLQWVSEENTAEQVADAERELARIKKILAKRS